MINQNRLKELLTYNRDTGQFIWNFNRYKCRKGQEAGSVHKKDGYRYIMVDGERYGAHRLAWLYVNGNLPELQIDHINHDKTDNKFSNLRLVSNQDNQKNCSLRKNNTSGTVGVSYSKTDKVWVATIKVNGKKLYLGSSSDINEAISLRKDANKKYNFHENHGK